MERFAAHAHLSCYFVIRVTFAKSFMQYLSKEYKNIILYWTLHWPVIQTYRQRVVGNTHDTLPCQSCSSHDCHNICSVEILNHGWLFYQGEFAAISALAWFLLPELDKWAAVPLHLLYLAIRLDPWCLKWQLPLQKVQNQFSLSSH